ncbi:MAG: efflux RND transporter periplasmic adaptor subunit [Planctomycetota bacterium]
MTGCAIVGALAAVAYATQRPARAEHEAAPRATAVELAGVALVDSYQTTRAYTGTTRAPRAVDLGFPLGGELAEVLVRDGQVVAAGEVIARLDLRGLRARLAQLEAARRAAEAELAELRAGPRPQTIAAARARLRGARARLALADLELKRREQLRQAAVVAEQELDAARHSRDAQAAEVEALAAQLEELEAGTRPERLNAAEARLAELVARLSQLAVEERDRVLRAPFAGTVGSVSADPGAVLAAGQPVARVVERAPLEAWVGVPPTQVASLSPGSAQTLLWGERPCRARVSALLPELDPITRTRTVILTLEEAPAALTAEQIVRLVVTEAVPAQGAWLPLAALSRGERDVWTCFVAEGQPLRARRALLRVVHTEPERALVAGLQPGWRVVQSGAHRLVSGQRLEAAQQPAQQPARLEPSQPAGQLATAQPEAAQ